METPAPSRPAAPAVVAVVVTRNPGPWFEDVVEALAAQDYPNLAILFIDSASDTDPTPRLVDALPNAYVRLLEENRGYGAAANHVTEIVDGAAFYCFLHDDAAPAPAAIRTMVDEAVRSNAAIVGAKLVQFEDQRRLLQVGEAIDKTGERSVGLERGELDQEQHDAVRDVFVTPSGCLLVRTDLFGAVGGFDDGIDVLNDDLNLCWRAHVAGGRVVVAPDAVVRHVEALDRDLPVEDRRHRLIRHRMRTVLSCYSGWHLARVLPQAALVALIEIVYSFLVGRRRQARDVAGAWWWNWRRRDEIVEWRHRVAEFRRVPDAEIRGLQIRGSARVLAFFRGQLERGGTRSARVQARWRALVRGLRSGELWWPIAAWAVTLVILGFGSRHLLFRPIAVVGGFPDFDRSPGELLDAYLSGWRTVGLGSTAPAPTALGLLAGAGTVFLGAMGTLRRVILLGSIVAGLVGAHRLVRPTGSARAQAAAVVVYGAIPVGLDAVAAASWGSLTAYAVVPWVLSHLARAAGWAPFGDVAGPAGPSVAPDRRPVARIAALGVVTAVGAAVDPALVVVVALTGAALAVGSLLAGSVRQLGALVAATGGAVGVAVALHVPWALDYVLPGASWELFVGARGTTPAADLAGLLRFDVGPNGGGVLAYGFLVAAALPLLIGRGWRFEWAVRAWVVVVAAVGVTWADAEGWLPVAAPPPEMLLTPAVGALALAVALGVVAFEIDLRAYGFGWRQIASAAAAVGLLLGSLSTLLDAGHGSWHLPSGDLATTFAFLDDAPAGARVLWIGDPDVLPLPGRPLDLDGTDGVVYATSQDGLPDITDAWLDAGGGPVELIRDALSLAVDGEVSRLGRMLAPMAIHYVVLPESLAPDPLGGLHAPRSEAVVDALGDQLDLAQVAVNPAYVVYRNEAALPGTATVGPTSGSSSAFDVDADAIEGATPALTDVTGPTTREGPVVAGSRILHSAAASDGWELLVEGRRAPPTKLFGWAQGFEPATGGSGVLRYDTSPLRYGVLGFQLLFWIIALALARRLPAASVLLEDRSVDARSEPVAEQPVPAEVPS